MVLCRNPRNLLRRGPRRLRRQRKRPPSRPTKRSPARARECSMRGRMARGSGASERAIRAQHDERRIVPPSKTRTAAESPRRIGLPVDPGMNPAPFQVFGSGGTLIVLPTSDTASKPHKRAAQADQHARSISHCYRGARRGPRPSQGRRFRSARTSARPRSAFSLARTRQ
jgi:hypothetical protein